MKTPKSLPLPAPGSIITTAWTIPQKWHRTTWRVNDNGTATPIHRQHYWCSVRGALEVIENGTPAPITPKLFPASGRVLLTINGDVVENGKF
jgi:hypothetical protein